MTTSIDNQLIPEPASAGGSWRELASRSSDGFSVDLYWLPDGDEVRVHVSERRANGRRVRSRAAQAVRAGGLLPPVRAQGAVTGHRGIDRGGAPLANECPFVTTSDVSRGELQTGELR